MQMADAALLVLEWQYGLCTALGLSFHPQEYVRKNLRQVPRESAQPGFAVRAPEEMLLVESSPPDLLFLGCCLPPFGWDLQELSLNTSQNSGLCCYVWRPKSFIFNPDVPLGYCISAFERFSLFLRHAQKYCWKFHSLSRLLVLPVCCQGCSTELS